MHRVASFVLRETARRRSHIVRREKREGTMLGAILIVVLILALVGALPRWSHSRSWGYFPTGGLGLVLLIVVVLALIGRL
jgi:uncharacterized protein DUF3309